MKNLIAVSALLFSLLIGKQIFAQSCSTMPNALVSVTKQNVTGYKQIIFTFKKPLAANFTVSAVTTAGAAYTGIDGVTYTIPGCHFKKITFTNVAWMCTTANTVTADLRIKRVKCTEQFEGMISYRIGYCASTYHHQSVVNTSTQRKIILWFHN